MTVIFDIIYRKCIPALFTAVFKWPNFSTLIATYLGLLYTITYLQRVIDKAQLMTFHCILEILNGFLNFYIYHH